MKTFSNTARRRGKGTHVLLLVVFGDGTSLLVVSVETLVESFGSVV